MKRQPVGKLVYSDGNPNRLRTCITPEEQRCWLTLFRVTAMKKLTAKPYIRMLRRKLTPTFSSEAMVRYEYHAKAFTLYMIESARSGVNGNRWMAAIWASGSNISGLGSTPQQARGALLRKIRGLQRVLGFVTVSI